MEAIRAYCADEFGWVALKREGNRRSFEALEPGLSTIRQEVFRKQGRTKGGCRERHPPSIRVDPLEQELQSELNQPWAIQLGVHNSESAVVLTVQQPVFGGPNWTRLNVLKNSVRNCKPSLLSGPKFVVLNNAMSQLLIPCFPKRCIDARLVTEFPSAGSGEAARVEPGKSGRTKGCAIRPCRIPVQHSDAELKFCEKPAGERAVDPPYEIGSGKPF